MSKYWKREGLKYVATTDAYRILPDGRKHHVGFYYKKLGFVAYHLIKWIHGQEKLDKMALNTSIEGLNNEI
jgi:hypothetical protein